MSWLVNRVIRKETLLSKSTLCGSFDCSLQKRSGVGEGGLGACPRVPVHRLHFSPQMYSIPLSTLNIPSSPQVKFGS